MKLYSFMALLVALASSLETTHARGQAEHVVVVVWDGLRPDFVTPQYTPTLYSLATRGTFFLNHHSAYITSTEVNGAALATGMQPARNGIMANYGYRADISWLGPYGTEALDAVRRGDALSDGNYLGAATLPEILQQAGFPTVVAGTKPVALLHDRSARKTTQAQKDSVTLFAGQTLPRAVLETLTNSFDIGVFPASRGPRDPASTNSPAAPASALPSAPTDGSSRGRGAANSPDSWTTKALVRGLWKKGIPKYSLLWLSEPDAAQHMSGLGSESAVAALENSDKNLASVLKALEDKGVLERTDIFVVSDHGFSTVSQGTDLIESLRKAKFTAGRQFQNPEPGDILVINLGGSASFYVFDREESVIRRLVDYLQTTDFAGVIFSGLSIEGTFPLTQAHLNTGSSAPDVVVSMRWTNEKNDQGVPGSVASIDGRRGFGTHASLSPWDLRNTLIAAGPDFKKAFVSDLPSGNIDLVPTALSILGVNPPKPTDGRVLYEAMAISELSAPKPIQETVEASRDLGFIVWNQYLKLTKIGTAVYFDEGNGAARLKRAGPSPGDPLQSAVPAPRSLNVSRAEAASQR